MKTMHSLKDLKSLNSTKICSAQPNFGVKYETGHVDYSVHIRSEIPKKKRINEEALKNYVERGYSFSEQRKKEIKSELQRKSTKPSWMSLERFYEMNKDRARFAISTLINKCEKNTLAKSSNLEYLPLI